jgi:CheY-like chemotaxis protein
VRKLVKTLLEGQGFRVLAAADGLAALEMAKGHAGTIDLLLTDMVMPGMGGKELADRLCATRPGLKVLFISGYTEAAVGELSGCGSREAHFLGKPFTSSQLRNKIQWILAGGR